MFPAVMSRDVTWCQTTTTFDKLSTSHFSVCDLLVFFFCPIGSSASCPTWLWWYEISVPMATGGTRDHLHFPPSNSCPFHLHRNNILGWMSGPLQSQSVSVWELGASYLCPRPPVSVRTFTSWWEWWSRSDLSEPLGLILTLPLALYFYYTHISSNNLANKQVMT